MERKPPKNERLFFGGFVLLYIAAANDRGSIIFCRGAFYRNVVELSEKHAARLIGNCRKSRHCEESSDEAIQDCGKI